MGKVRAMKVPEFKRIGKSAFERKFINKPLEPLAGELYGHLLQIYKEKYGLFVLGPYFRNLFAHLTHFSCVLEFVKDIHDDKWLDEHYQIGALDTLKNIRIGVDKALVEEIASLNLTGDKIVFASVERKDLEPIIMRWNELLMMVPDTHSVEYDKDGVLTDKYLQDLEATLMTIWDGINILATQARELYIAGVIQLVKDSGIKPSNALYRDIYDCLKMADLLTEEQIHLHDASTNRYVRENYIKAKYGRLPSNK